ncbi:hypothetical protein [Burkholderia ubonensis]|uniref:hypothetical protein n=1 Tax=Burkholderia ubonensis TaxID=101571 RepID=UPI0012FC658A|nr:hypothetical protein [Burkholderia ubonensis]
MATFPGAEIENPEIARDDAYSSVDTAGFFALNILSQGQKASAAEQRLLMRLIRKTLVALEGDV